MTGDNWTTILVALIAALPATLGMVFAALALRKTTRMEPVLKAVDRAVNTAPLSEPTLRDMAATTGTDVARLADQEDARVGERSAPEDSEQDQQRDPARDEDQ